MNRQAKALLAELCQCNTIDTTRRGQPCSLCGGRIISTLEEAWLWRQSGLGHKSHDDISLP